MLGGSLKEFGDELFIISKTPRSSIKAISWDDASEEDRQEFRDYQEKTVKKEVEETLKSDLAHARHSQSFADHINNKIKNNEVNEVLAGVMERNFINGKEKADHLKRTGGYR